jgi:hypothetical protein
LADVSALRVVAVARPVQAAAVVQALATDDPSRTPLPTLVVCTAAAARQAPEPAAQRGDNWLLLDGPSRQVEALGSVRVAAVWDHDAAGFGPVRALAFEGVHVVVVFGDNIPERVLRCRAAENRVFLVQVASSEVAAYDPRGCRIATAPLYPLKGVGKGTASAALELATADAANKEFAPGTNPFTGRRPHLYEL